MVRHSAEHQARYRKTRAEREPDYKQKESERVKRYYTTTSMLSEEEKQERRRKGKLLKVTIDLEDEPHMLNNYIYIHLSAKMSKTNNLGATLYKS